MMARLSKTLPVALALLLCLLVPLLFLTPALAEQGHAGGGQEAAATAEHGGGEHGGEGEHGGHGVNLLAFWIKHAINFAVLFGLLFYFLRKPVGEFFRSRREQIANQLAGLERARDEAKAQLKEYENKLAQAAAEREKILAEFVAQGEAEKKRIIAEAEASAGRIRDAARLSIEAELKSAKRQIREELADAAVELAAQKLRLGIKPEDHSRLIDEYLTKVKVVELK